MKVVLSHGYFLHEDEAEQKIMMPYPPQGILHIGTYLQTKGIECDIFDSTFESFETLSAYLKTEKPAYLGLYANLMTRKNVLRIIRFMQNSKVFENTNVILGGPDVRHHAENYLRHGADYCIPGEGEHTFLQLISQLDDKKDVSSLKGIIYKNKQGKMINTGDAELLPSLDFLPFPDFKLIDIQRYLDTWKKYHGYSSITLSTMRGCPFTCRWCSKAVFGRSFRRRSAKSVVEEMTRLKKEFNPDRFWIVDDVFTITKKWLVEFNDEIKASKLDINYECISRADRMDVDIIELLRASGCFRLWIGAESGSQKVLDLMARGVKVDLVRETIKKTKDAGIETGTFLMLGYLGESEKDILETVEHLKSAQPDQCTITLSYPIPGTDFYEDVSSTILQIPGEWGTYSDREIDFKRTYPRDYYSSAIKFVHHSFQSQKAKRNGYSKAFLKHRLAAKFYRSLMKLRK